MKPIKSHSKRRSQRGAATIFVTVVLLMALALIALYTNRSAIMEQRLTANEVRAKQAFAAANAGLEVALGRWHTNNLSIPTTNADRVVTTALQSGTGTLSWFQARYYDSGAAAIACPVSRTTDMPLAPQPPSLTQVIVVSCGWSDDETSVQRVSQIIGPSDSGTGNVAVPLVARGNANLAVGGATILNYYNDLTVWTGLDLLGGAATAKTMVRNIVTDPLPSGNGRIPSNSSPACNNPPAGYECSTQKTTLGHDVVAGDTNLSGQTGAGFFEYLFGKQPAAYRDSTASWIVDPAGTLPNRDSTSISSINGMTERTIWIEGNVNGTMSPSQAVIGAPGNKSVLLIINGDWDMSGFNGEINGLVYVNGNVTGNGSPTIYGSLVVAGSANLSGNIKIVYDPGTLSSIPKVGKAAKLPGTWRDW